MKMDTKQIIEQYLDIVRETRSPKTWRTYRSALTSFTSITKNAALTVETYILFLRETKDMNPGTQALYRSALAGLYVYHASTHPEINLAALKNANRQFARRRGPRLPKFDLPAVERLIAKASTMRSGLEELRNRAFILSLADSGLRIEEACSLVRGDMDWTNKKAVIIGKGDKEAVVHFKDRSIRAMRDYLSKRAELDGASGRDLSSLPLFARHDRGAGGKVKPVLPGGMWLAIKAIAKSVDSEKVTPHDLRHYFVSTFYARSRDLKATQEMARHSNISITDRYTHLSVDMDELYERTMETK